LFKALLAASLAMLFCCAASVWGGPVHPVTDPLTAPPIKPLNPPLVRLIDLPAPEESGPASLLEKIIVDGFIPISLSSGSAAVHGSPAAPAALPSPDPAVQPTVIPLPTPLYAGLALLAIAVVARRAVLRAC
jgi:hypothetical protein